MFPHASLERDYVVLRELKDTYGFSLYMEGCAYLLTLKQARDMHCAESDPSEWPEIHRRYDRTADHVLFAIICGLNLYATGVKIHGNPLHTPGAISAVLMNFLQEGGAYMYRQEELVTLAKAEGVGV